MYSNEPSSNGMVVEAHGLEGGVPHQVPFPLYRRRRVDDPNKWNKKKKIILKELFLQPLSSQKDSFRSDRPVFSLFYTECVCVRVSMFIVDYKYQKEEKKKKKEDD